jgi:hypothetical protein
MVLAEGCTTTLECRECEILENGTMNGRFNILPSESEWDGEMLTLIDHSKVYLPSPDVVMPLAHHAEAG